MGGSVIGLLHPGEMGAAVAGCLTARGHDVRWVSQGRGPATAERWVGNDKPMGQPLSWTADGRTVAFPISTQSGGITTVRLLDTTAPGSSLRSARSSVVFLAGGNDPAGQQPLRRSDR